VLTGGATQFRGCSERIVRDLRSSVNAPATIHVAAPLERKYSAWSGGSMLGALAAYRAS